MKTIIMKKHQLCFDSELISEEVAKQCFEIDYWEEIDAVVGSAQGRGTTWFVDLARAMKQDAQQSELKHAALRHYRRGGLFGKIVKDHYLFTSWEQTRSLQEFNLLTHLAKAGVNVPRPIAAQAKKLNFCYQADILTQKIPNARDLVAILQENTLSKDAYMNIGKEVRKLHDAYVNHTDLNIHNILLDESGKVWIIDFDKCHFEQEQNKPSPWQAKNLARLKRSFVKEVNKRQIKWQESSDWQALLDGYYL